MKPPLKPKVMYQPKTYVAHFGEMPIKVWVMDEAEKCHVTTAAIRNRIARGKYPALVFRKINPRVVFVTDTRTNQRAVA